MKKNIFLAIAIGLPIAAFAQGNNTGMGGADGNYESLAHRVFNLEKKTDAFNVYFNYASSFQELDDGDRWTSSFKNKQARIEIKGNITDKLSYRFRHRLNKNNTAQSEDNFAKATDILMVGYQLTPKVGIQGGKMCQNWGGFEFDENPMYIYQYSDMVDNMDNFMAGVNLSIKPVSTQEIAVNVTDAYNNKFADEYGSGAKSLEKGSGTRRLEAANHPLTYIALWSGSFFGDRLQTRWSYGIQTQARHKYSRMVVLGQKLNLPTVQWYVDYMGAFDGLDRLRIASSEGTSFLNANGANYFSDVHYNSLITKLNWQFAPQWNLMLKGTYETASVSGQEEWKNYRKSMMYLASVEYYPVKSQDFRVFLAYLGRHYNYSDKVAKYGLDDHSTNRIELGFMYRIKAF
ncbi:porin [Hallella multisaccharivorax]|uniref:porin n=1 Tax=Hallella multisaccharivorax TaxID=310514 RepID=UPI0036061445